MRLTLAEARLCFSGFLISTYREELRRVEGYSIQAMVAGAQEDLFEKEKDRITEKIEALMFREPDEIIGDKVIDDASIRQQIMSAGIPFSQVKK